MNSPNLPVYDPRAKGRRLFVPRSRVNVCDLLAQEQRIPNCTHERLIDLAAVAKLRSQAKQRVSWPVLFIKAYGLVAKKYPVLRQCYLNWPWPHLYEHPHSVAFVSVSRRFRNEDWLFFGRMTCPEGRDLLDVQRELDLYSTEPVAKIFRLQLQHSGMNWALRRMLWWIGYNVWGDRRARRFGTFGMTTISAQGANITQPPNILTSTFSYGPLDEQGRSRLALSYDHRLLDGLTVAGILADVEHTLQTEIAAELATLATAVRAAA